MLILGIVQENRVYCHCNINIDHYAYTISLFCQVYHLTVAPVHYTVGVAAELLQRVVTWLVQGSRPGHPPMPAPDRAQGPHHIAVDNSVEARKT